MRRRSALRASLGVAVAAAIAHALMQWQLPGLPDRDAWFHARLADLMARGEAPWHGLTFPWLTQSGYADLPMDWSLLWHWLLAPFVTTLGTVTGIRTFAAVQATALAVAFHHLLRRGNVKAPGAWTALLVVGSAEWLFRSHFGRPTPLAIALLLVVLDQFLHGRGRGVGVVVATVVALLTSHVPAPLVLVAGAGAAGLWLARGGRPPLRGVAHVAIGGVLGLALQPGLWSHGPGGVLDTATFHVWDLMAGSLSAAASGGAVTLPGGEVLVLPLPRELGSPGVDGLLSHLWLPFAATASAVAMWWWRRRDALATAAALLAIAGLAGTLRSGRFFEYWHVFALLAAASAVSGAGTRGSVRPHVQLVGLTALVLGTLAVRTLGPLADRHGNDAGAAVAPALAALEPHAQPGDIVWHGSWDDFAPLFHFAPDLRYVTGMDPWWLVAHDPEDARVYAQTAAGALDEATLRSALSGRFGARHVLLWSPPNAAGETTPRYPALEAALRQATWAEVVHDDPAVVAFTLR